MFDKNRWPNAGLFSKTPNRFKRNIGGSHQTGSSYPTALGGSALYTPGSEVLANYGGQQYGATLGDTIQRILEQTPGPAPSNPNYNPTPPPYVA